MVPGLKSLLYEERLSCLGLWTLEERRNRADLLEVFKMYKGLSLLHFNEFFKISSVVVNLPSFSKDWKATLSTWFTKTFLLGESGEQVEFFAATCHRRWEYQRCQECYWEIALYTDGPLHGLERSACPYGPPSLPVLTKFLQSARSCARRHAVCRPMLAGFRSFSTGQVHVCLGRPRGRFQSAAEAVLELWHVDHDGGPFLVRTLQCCHSVTDRETINVECSRRRQSASKPVSKFWHIRW